ncbi:hypothetical protein C9374_013845 [Naegleria lovaniensis]|uniref:Protein tyrosine phosphatase n=1 Tax=Naegleria lovaniensis TaxID=51637 RepID=A0AA88GUR1_NAELO|nr:uncharacterized protein C9374_013845 [Naegleria lovaniensis]KAG2389285.1 hypothetical protein C9374_013845 [Naegleria lovaniensis]
MSGQPTTTFDNSTSSSFLSVPSTTTTSPQSPPTLYHIHNFDSKSSSSSNNNNFSNSATTTTHHLNSISNSTTTQTTTTSSSDSCSSPLQRTKPFLGNIRGSSTSTLSEKLKSSNKMDMSVDSSATEAMVDVVDGEVIDDDEEEEDETVLVIRNNSRKLSSVKLDDVMQDEEVYEEEEGDDEEDEGDMSTSQSNSRKDLSEISSSVSSSSSLSSRFPNMAMLDLSALKKPTLTSVMQHSFMITPKRIGSNLVNSYDTHHHNNTLQVPNASVSSNLSHQHGDHSDTDEELGLSKLNLTKQRFGTIYNKSSSSNQNNTSSTNKEQIYIHTRNMSFSKEVDGQVFSDDDDEDDSSTQNSSQNRSHRFHHEKRASVVQPIGDDDELDLTLSIGNNSFTRKSTTIVDDDEDMDDALTLQVNTPFKSKEKKLSTLHLPATNSNTRAMTDDNSDSPALSLGGLSKQGNLNHPQEDNTKLSPNTNSKPSGTPTKSPHSGKSISFMMPPTLKSGNNPYHYNKHCVPARPPVYSLERHVLSQDDEDSRVSSPLATTDPELLKEQLESLFENPNSHQCPRLIREFEELEEIDVVTWLHKRLYFRTGLKYMDMNRYSNVLPNDDTRFKLYKGIGPVLHVNFTSSSMNLPLSNFALLSSQSQGVTPQQQSPISITSSHSTTTSSSGNNTNNSSNNNNRVVSPNAEILSTWEEDYINANLIKARKEFLFNWDEFSMVSSPLSITSASSTTTSTSNNYGTTRKEREELAERVNMVDYICTQGPLPYTAAHFWKMIYQSNSHVILMIGREQEETGVKCAIYYPTPNNSGSNQNPFILSSTLTTASSLDGVSPRNMLSVTGMKNNTTDSFLIDVTPPKSITTNTQKWKLEVTIPKNDDNEEAVKWIIPKELMQRVIILKLKRSKASSQPSSATSVPPSSNDDHDEILDQRKVYLLQYVGWVDQSVPTQIPTIMKVIDHINDIFEKRKNELFSLKSVLSSSHQLPFHTAQLLQGSVLDNIGPLVVHCSAGIGRTGTFCAVDCALKQFKAHVLKYVMLNNKSPLPPPTTSSQHVVKGSLQNTTTTASSPQSFPTTTTPCVNIPAFPFNIFNIVKKLKEHRAGMVQTENQYEFIYKVVIRSCKEILKKWNCHMVEKKSNNRQQ